MKKNIDIGLDIGISSVGWAITDVETLQIIKHGARLFPTVDDAKDSKLKNEARREARSARRQINRRKTLRRDFIKMLIDRDFISDINFDLKGNFVKEFIKKYIEDKKTKSKWENESRSLPYILHLRKKALNDKVEKKALIVILYWYINHRGFKYTVAENNKGKDNKKIIKESQYPVENQINFYHKNNYLNGEYNRIFHQNEYLLELEKIFQNQNLDKEFINDFLRLFERQRSFEDGPGNENTPNRYGKYYELKNNELIKRKEPLTNIWELTVGKCTFFPNENRAPKASFTASIFNLLNDLSNILVKTTGEVLSKEDKMKLIQDIALKQGTKDGNIINKVKKELLNIFKLSKDDESQIEGLRQDKKEKKIITPLKAFYLFKDYLDPKYLDFDYLFDKNLQINENNIFDKLVNIFARNKSVEKRKLELSKLSEKLNKETIENISKVAASFSETHSLSYYAMQKMIPDIFSTPHFNQMNWAHNNDIKFNKDIDFGTNYLKTLWIEDVIATPSVKRAFRQTTKVLNAIFQLCKDQKYHIRSIVIEMAREANNSQAKKAEQNRQSYLEELNKDIKGQHEGLKISNRTINKLRLLEQQCGKDAYTNEDIKAEDVIKNPGKYDIDHIIPYSQSYSNNRSNLVLTTQQNNHKKGKRTPKQFLTPQEFTKMQEHWEAWYKYPQNKALRDVDKFQYLTTAINYSKPENQLGFIQRNLVDTRYTTKAILDALLQFKNNPQNEYDFKVKTINGKMTNFARNHISTKRDKKGNIIEQLIRPQDPTLPEGEKLPLFEEIILKNGQKYNKKSRIWHGHHAEDAYIVTVLNSQYNDSKAIEKILSNPNKRYEKFKENILNHDQKLNNINLEELSKKFDLARKELNQNVENVHFSRMVSKPRNTKLFNETLYKGKINKQGLIDKYTFKNILDENFDGSKYFGDDAKNKEKLLIFRNNKLFYNALNDVYKNYYDSNDKTNPFKKAKEKANLDSRYLEIPYQTKNKKSAIFKVRKLAILEQEGEKGKNPLRIVQAHENGNSFYESMEWVAMNIYKNEKDKWKIILIDASNHTFKVEKNGKVTWIPKEYILKKQLLAKNITNDKIYATIYKGDLIQLANGIICYVCGQNESQDKIELKYLHRGFWNEIDKSQNHVTINTFLKNAKLIKSNILSNKFVEKFTF